MINKDGKWENSNQPIVPTEREAELIRLVRRCDEAASYIFEDLEIRMATLGVNLSYIEAMIEGLEVSILVLEEEKLQMKPRVNMGFLKDINTKLGDSNG